ncbi:hypothetical protein FJZ53_06915 [Candidatus Woesearchaeota archaeon]|nr:hypothetical protein [Candidatus Woesearchaeota archaeon]
MGFLLDYELYATEIYYQDKEFTPKQLGEYFDRTEKQTFADQKHIKKVTDISRKLLTGIISKHNTKLDDTLEAKTSSVGRELAHLALLHCDMCWLISLDSENFEKHLNDYSAWVK